VSESHMESLEEAVESIDDALFEGEFERAADELQRARDQFDEAPQLEVLEAELAFERDEFDTCIDSCETTLDIWAGASGDELDSHAAELLAFKGYSLFYLDEDEAARHTFNDAVCRDPDLWMALLGRAEVHEFQGYLKAALLDLDRAIWLDDQEPEPFSLRGSVHLQLNNLEEAERDFGYALEIDPLDEEAQLNLARLQALDGRQSVAIETLERLVREGVEPMFVMPGALLRSQLLMGMGSTDAAIEDARTAIDKSPDQPWGHLQLAASQMTAGDAGEAIATLREAEELIDNPRSVPDLHSLRASAYQRLDKPEKAERHMDKVEGAARLPGIVYGEELNPAANIPINPDRPLDVETVLTEVFGDPNDAPPGYADDVRSLLDRLPEIAEEHRRQGKDQIEIDLPPLTRGGESPGTFVLRVAE